MNIEQEIKRILATGKYPDPRLGAFGKAIFREKQISKLGLPRYGKVSDNKDPMKLGRVRVACDMIAPGAVTPWIPVIRPWSSPDSGWWSLPDIGTQVLLGFIGNNTAQPVCLGCIYDLEHLPPKHSTENPADSIVFQTKNHRLEIIDEDGKEAIIFSSAKGKIRLVLSNEKGVEFINEMGDITIEARNITLEGKKGVFIEAEKKVEINSGENLSVKAKKNIGISCDKEVKMKGKNIKLEGSRGITTEGKQLAAEGDKVMGFDVHIMVVPSGNGTAKVPLPHPFLGKLVDKLSEDVKIKGHNAAVKGSVAKHDDAMHNQLPGTIKFDKNPKKEGEVTGGTGKKLKINGKEAAVIGSTVSTCNDIGVKENSVIMAVGASMPMPVIINPKNMEQYKLEREKENKKSPEFTTVKWIKGSIKEGEKAELSAQVKDIDDGNMVTFQVWKDGQDPNSHIPYGTLPATIEGGAAKAEWSPVLPNGNEIPPAEDPVFFFSVHSAWCPYKKSGNLTVELKRPEIKKLQWQINNNLTNKAFINDEVDITFDTMDIEDGENVTIDIYDSNKSIIETLQVTIVNSRVSIKWQVKTLSDKEYENEKNTPEYYFVPIYNRVNITEKPLLKLYGKIINLKVGDENDNSKYMLIFSDNTEKICNAQNGMINLEEVPIGKVQVFHM